MQQFYENKIDGRLDILEDILHEQMRSICDALNKAVLRRSASLNREPWRLRCLIRHSKDSLA